MINSEDIRAGNQVLFKASGSSVTILKVEDDKLLLDTFPRGSYCSNSDISGVPLTKSMLRKLSFDNSEDSVTWDGQGIRIHEKPDGFFYGLRISKTRAKMEYLHQLQNYLTDFYALFRQENRSLDLSQVSDLSIL